MEKIKKKKSIENALFLSCSSPPPRDKKGVLETDGRRIRVVTRARARFHLESTDVRAHAHDELLPRDFISLARSIIHFFAPQLTHPNN